MACVCGYVINIYKYPVNRHCIKTGVIGKDIPTRPHYVKGFCMRFGCTLLLWVPGSLEQLLLIPCIQTALLRASSQPRSYMS